MSESTNAMVGATDHQGDGKRAAGLFLVVLVTAIAQPVVIIAVPLVVLLTVRGARGVPAFSMTAFAMLFAFAGPRDGIWFMERAWALLVGGVFAALSMARPAWRLTSRALGAVAGAGVAVGAGVALRAGSWQVIDWTVSERLRSGFATSMDAVVVLRDGAPVPAALVSAIFRTVTFQAAVFPALVALQSMAALTVAWWLYVRLAQRGDRAVGELGSFRFNDHLVWLLITGLVLVAFQLGESVTRVGENLAVFMAALYAFRGAGVVVFVSGRPSFVGYTMFALGIVFAAPAVIGCAVLIGIADTWLDLRARAGSFAT